MKNGTCWMLAALLVVLAACGGGTADQGSIPEETGAEAVSPAAGDGSGPTAGEAAADSLDRYGLPVYHTHHDPDAVYTYDDLPNRMNYMKINFEQLDAEELNRVIHRLRTEPCTCDGCKGLTVDECLASKPECGTGMEIAREIIREEREVGKE